MREFHYIIIGAGSAGCVMAEFLSRSSDVSVLVCEAGGSHNKLSIKVPIGYGLNYTNSRVNWMYETEADSGINNRTSYWPRGKVFGGSSAINAMVYHRGHPRDYDDWQSMGNLGWGYKDVAKVFSEFESFIDRKGNRDNNHPLAVQDASDQYHPLQEHIFKAINEAGIKTAPPYNHETANSSFDNGIAPYLINTKNGFRVTAADAFLVPALKRKNCTISSYTQVTKILCADGQASAIRVKKGNSHEVIKARREIILCAGAINSPQLLMLSGIGNQKNLNALGIETIIDNPNVGQNLQDHLGINYYFRSKIPTLNQELGTIQGQIKASIRYFWSRKGAFSLSVNQLGGIICSDPQLIFPDLQLYINPLSYSSEYNGKRLLLKPDSWPGFIIGFNTARPKSLGHIALKSSDPSDAPLIYPNYLGDNDDVQSVLAGARIIRKIGQTTALKAILAASSRPDLDQMPDDAIIEDFRNRSGSVFHPCGTCRMAPIEKGGVVDSELRLHGIKNLRIADASIFPNITSANTNAPTIMVARALCGLMGGV